MSRFWKSGEPFVWITGASLAFCLLMVGLLLLIVLVNGLGYFWPADVRRFTVESTAAGGTFRQHIVGEVCARERIPHPDQHDAPDRHRIKIKRGNRDVYGGLPSSDFVWLDESRIVEEETPAGLVALERLEMGNLYGFIVEIRDGGQRTAGGGEEGWNVLNDRLPGAWDTRSGIDDIKEGRFTRINHRQEKLRLRLRRLELENVRSGSEVRAIRREQAGLEEEFRRCMEKLEGLRASMTTEAVLSCADHQGPGYRQVAVPLSEIIRAYRPNDMGFLSKTGFYIAKIWEFVTGNPREANTEGGVFPAIFGTVLMVMIMSIAVTPFGILAAVYLREYARQGPLVSAVRIAVNNLAGVPSIVFGVFGVGFFIYFVGGTIDEFFFPERLPSPTFGTGGILWASLTLALLTVPVVIVSTEEGLAAIPGGLREASLALGATKFETTWRVVFPTVTPSILTGIILAIARGAGEVAPLMLTGVVNHADRLAVDVFAPCLHLERKFMHLGFHIYDVAFQAPNADAARPMVFATTLLLLAIVVVLNLAAIIIRRRLRRRYASAAV